MIEAWVTDPSGIYLAHLDRSEASPFRRFAVSLTRGADPGAGSLEHHLDNALLREIPTLLADGNLVWMRYAGRTITWVIEERQAVLDEGEGARDWVKVVGRGVKQLLADRVVWPSEFDESHLDPSQWGLGGWSTRLDASAAAGQRVVPVATTTGAVVGIPVQITGRPVGAGAASREIGVIASIEPGVSVTLVDDLAHSFRSGSRILGATQQWRRFVNRAAGEMLWDLISESNPRFRAQIARGTIESNGADGWTQDFRFDNLLDVVAAVCASFGDVEMDGLTFNYRSSPGTDRSSIVIFEEGADLLRLERFASDRDTISWVVAEGTGEGSRASLAVASDPAVARRREAFLDAKDAGNLPLVQLRATAAIDERRPVDSIALEVTADRFAPFVDFDLNDTVRAVAPSRETDTTAVVVAIYLEEGNDERVRVGIDVNSPRQEHLLRLEEGNRSTATSIGVRNRQPQGQLVPFSFLGADVFDDIDTMDVLIYVPDSMYVVTESRAFLRFRQFFASAKSASSGGAATSGASSASTSGASSGHDHTFATQGSAGSGGTSTAFATASPTGPTGFWLPVSGGGSGQVWKTGPETSAHNHGMAHTHSTPDHTHGLTYGVYKEAYPASHSVTLKVYYWDDTSAWDLVTTISGITTDVSDQDLTAYITGPGLWRLELQSAAAQPNGGRLGCDVSGYVIGAIQSV